MQNAQEQQQQAEETKLQDQGKAAEQKELGGLPQGQQQQAQQSQQQNLGRKQYQNNQQQQQYQQYQQQYNNQYSQQQGGYYVNPYQQYMNYYNYNTYQQNPMQGQSGQGYSAHTGQSEGGRSGHQNQNKNQGGSGGYQYNKQHYKKFQTNFPRAKNYKSFESIAEAFPKLAKVNQQLDVDKIENARCFVLRSNNDDDIHKAIKYGIWTSTPRNNEILNKAYEESSAKNEDVYIFYSVVKSGQFVGVAKMISKVVDKQFAFWWQQHKWKGQFNIEWVYIKDVSYKNFETINSINDTPIVRSRDCTEITWKDHAQQVMKIFNEAKNEPNIFADFYFMDQREDYLRQNVWQKNQQNQYLQQYQQQYGNFMNNFNYTQSMQQIQKYLSQVMSSTFQGQQTDPTQLAQQQQQQQYYYSQQQPNNMAQYQQYYQQQQMNMYQQQQQYYQQQQHSQQNQTQNQQQNPQQQQQQQSSSQQQTQQKQLSNSSPQQQQQQTQNINEQMQKLNIGEQDKQL